MLHVRKSESSFSFERFLWPVGNPYASRWPCGFLSQRTSASNPSQKPFVVRDGIIPLSWYFHNHPRPDLESPLILCVHEDLLSLVPLSWSESVYAYRTVALTPPEEQVGEILILAHLSQECFSFSAAKRRLRELQDFFGDRWSSLRKTMFLTPSFMEPRSHSSWAFYTKTCFELGQEWKDQVEILDWDKFRQRSSFRSVMAVDLTEPWICKDNYLCHFILSRGGEVFDVREYGQGEIEPLSPYHGWRVNKSPSVGESALSKESSLFVKHLRRLESEENVGSSFSTFPWPAWFSQWCRQLDIKDV